MLYIHTRRLFVSSFKFLSIFPFPNKDTNPLFASYKSEVFFLELNGFNGRPVHSSFISVITFEWHGVVTQTFLSLNQPEPTLCSDSCILVNLATPLQIALNSVPSLNLFSCTSSCICGVSFFGIVVLVVAVCEVFDNSLFDFVYVFRSHRYIWD